MIQYQTMTFFGFQKHFSTEEACYEHLQKLRFPDGYLCPKCGHTDAYFIETRKLFQCKRCQHQTSLTANTIFHKTRTPLQKWFWAIYLIGSDKGGCSAMRLKKMLGISYLTAWTMSHKIRIAMQDRNAQYKLNAIIEMDDAYFGGHEAGKRGRGAGNKSKVLIGVETKGNTPGFVAMRVVPTIDAYSIDSFASDTISHGQCIHTDGYPPYSILNDRYNHHPEPVKPYEVEQKLPWVHILISNAKNIIRGTYLGVSHKHLQRYLSEFCYRFNRRFVEPQIFNRILFACVTSHKVTYSELIE
jgi:transposase-like protein